MDSTSSSDYNNRPNNDLNVEQNKAKLYKPFFDEVNFSRVGFLFICFAVMSGGYISEILSCQTRYMLETNPYFRHCVGVLLFFIFIMLEGGWSFDKEEDDKASNSWSSGNVMHTGIIAFGLYCIFLLSSKSQFFYSMLFFALILVLYLVNTQRSYYLARERISESTNSNVLLFETVTAGSAFAVLIVGFVDYYMYQKKSHPTDFSFSKFILGAHKCASVTSLNNSR